MSKDQAVQRDSSRSRSSVRATLKPHQRARGLKPMLRSGMRNSAVQPPSSIRVRTSQMASQSSRGRELSVMRPSTSAPAGFVAK